MYQKLVQRKMYYSVSGMPRVGFVEDTSNYCIPQPPCEITRSQLHLLMWSLCVSIISSHGQRLYFECFFKLRPGINFRWRSRLSI